MTIITIVWKYSFSKIHIMTWDTLKITTHWHNMLRVTEIDKKVKREVIPTPDIQAFQCKRINTVDIKIRVI